MATHPPTAHSDRDPVPLRPFPGPQHPLGTRLPIPLSSFVGREPEIASIRALLRRPEVRLVTLTGPGGVGKTRLALRIAEELAAEFSDGVGFVALASVSDPQLVARTVAGALGLSGTAERNPADVLKTYLRERSFLLVLDNVEHLLLAAPLVTDWLVECPGLSVLTTSRAALRLTGEHEVAVAPLDCPDLSRLPPLDRLDEYPAVQLFVERAQAAQSSFSLTTNDTEAVAEICARLDGLPLAIELAAAHIKHLPPQALLARLEQRLPVLTGGPRDQPERLRGMHEAVAWSHDLLAPHERDLFRRLAVFVGGFTLEAAAAVLGGDDDVFDGVAALVDNSLLRQEEGADREPRFTMLETVRDYALECLSQSDELPAMRQRHAAYYMGFAEGADPAIWGGPESKRWLDRLESDIANFRAALVWFDSAGDGASCLRLAASLGGLWHYRSHHREGHTWLRRALPRAADDVPAARALALVKLAMLEGDFGRAAEGRMAEYAVEAVAIRRRLDNEQWLGRALLMLANTTDNLEDRVRIIDEAQEIFQRLGDLTGLAWARGNIARACLKTGDLGQARALYVEALDLFRRDGFHYGISEALLALGWIATDQGDYAAAAGHFAESLRLWGETGSHEHVASALTGSGVMAAEAGRLETASRLLGAAAALSEALGYVAPPMVRTWCEHAASAARAILGEERFASAWAAGRVHAPAAAVAEARASLAAAAFAPVASAPTAPAAAHGLTPREVEVVRLVAAGRSNREIADVLFVSVPTVKRHLTTVLGKLGLPSRSALNTYAHAHSLA